MVGLVIEGGGTRALFSAGVLDYFIEKELDIPYVVGVSAGSGIGASYTSKQHGRTKATMIDYLRTGNYAGLEVLKEKGSLFDLDLIYDEFPNKLYPFDYDTFFKPKNRFIITATNLQTGQVEYLEEYCDKKRLMNCFKASSSIPVVSNPIMVDDIPMMDGGIADSIPINKALDDGCDEVVLILSRNSEYIKKQDHFYNFLAYFKYLKYPKFYQAIKNRAKIYNETLELIKKLEKEKKVFIIRPVDLEIKRTENNPDVLTEWYLHGYVEAKEKYNDLLKFIEE